jgi:hypothetical protein
LFVQLL